MIIFRISSFKEAILNNSLPKAKYLSTLYSGFSLWIFLLITSALLTGCGSSKHIQTQIVKEIQLDTMYLSTEKYDSIYITQDKYIDRSRDTLYIKESNTEYRFKLLRDTIKEVRVDSIPYEVRITETIEVPRKLTWYDHTARATFWLMIGIIAICIFSFVTKLRKLNL